MTFSEKKLGDLSEALNQLAFHLEAFIGILENERAILDNNDVDQLSHSLDHKAIALEKIHHAQKLFEQALSTPSNGDDSKLALVIKKLSLDHQDKIKPVWHHVQKLLYQSDRLNLVNGVIITIMKNHNAALLQLLTQKPENNLYGQCLTDHHVVSTQQHKI